jgi:hypothetical protein
MIRTRPFRLAGALLALTLLPGVAAAGEPLAADHLKCFQIKDELGKTERRTVLATDLLPAKNPPFASATCKIRLPASHLCIEASKTNVLEGGAPYDGLPVVGAPARKFLCYRMRCPRERVEIEARDQFGERVIQTKKGSFLCVPAEDASGATPTPVVTPTPTLTVVAPTATATLNPTATATVTVTPTTTATIVPPTVTPTITPTPTATPTGSPTSLFTPSPIVIPTPMPCGGPVSGPIGGDADPCGGGICPLGLVCLPDESTEECSCEDVPCGGPAPSGGVCSALCPTGQLCIYDEGNCRCAPLNEACGGDIVPPVLPGQPDGNGGGQCSGLCIGVGMVCLPVNVDGQDLCGCFAGAGGGETPVQ